MLCKYDTKYFPNQKSKGKILSSTSMQIYNTFDGLLFEPNGFFYITFILGKSPAFSACDLHQKKGLPTSTKTTSAATIKKRHK